MLEKWHCHKCEKGFLLLEDDVKSVPEVSCPFCREKDHVEVVAGQNPDDHTLRDKMGCLWPSYNEFDKYAYLMRKNK